MILRHHRERQAALEEHADAMDGLDRIRVEASMPPTGAHRLDEPVLLVVAQRAHAGAGSISEGADAESVVIRIHRLSLLHVTLVSVPTVGT